MHGSDVDQVVAGKSSNHLWSGVERRNQLTAVREAFATGTRLVTLTGHGGIGKSRLARAYVREPDIASNLQILNLPHSHSRTLNAISEIPRIEQRDQSEPVASAAASNSASTTLLVVDGIDAAPDAPQALVELLSGNAQIQLLVTCREALQVEGEVAIAIPPLVMPKPGEQSLESLAKNESVQLFVHKAQTTDAAFELSDANATSLTSIVSLLQGNPLAITLAAARCGEVSLDTLLEDLQSAADPELAVDEWVAAWAIDTLPEPLPQALHRLTATAGGFSHHVATAITATLNVTEPTPQATLNALLSYGLIEDVTWHDGDERYDVSNAVTRQFGGSEQAHSTLQAARAAHARLFLEQAESMRRSIDSGDDEPLSWFVIEHGNLTNALTTFSQSNRWYLARRLVRAIWRPWLTLGKNGEVSHWLTTVLERFDPEHPDELEPELRFAAASIALNGDDLTEVRRHVTFGLGISGDLRNDYWHALLLSQSATVAARDRDYKHAINLFLLVLKVIEPYAGTRPVAARERDSALLAASVAYFAVGKADKAVQFAEWAQASCVLRKDRRGKAMAALNLSVYAAARGDRKGAVAGYREAIPLLWECGDDVAVSEGFAGLAGLALAQGLVDQSAQLLKIADELGSAGKPAPVQITIMDREAIRRALENSPGKRMAPSVGTTAAGVSRRHLITSLDQFLDTIEQSLEPRSNRSQKPSNSIVSRRELEVLQLIADGRTDQEIADELFIARRTVNDHVAHILMKMGVDNRAAAAARAIKLGLF